jgi:hypothetical protein
MGIIESDSVIHHTYFNVYRQSKSGGPERNLMLAVLVDAVQTFQKFSFPMSAREKELFRETKEWFWREDSEGLFSFINICEVFGLDPALFRRRLLWVSNRQGIGSPAPKVQLRVVANRRTTLTSSVENRRDSFALLEKRQRDTRSQLPRKELRPS